jgi:hypothetical protein
MPIVSDYLAVRDKQCSRCKKTAADLMCRDDPKLTNWVCDDWATCPLRSTVGDMSQCRMCGQEFTIVDSVYMSICNTCSQYGAW